MDSSHNKVYFASEPYGFKPIKTLYTNVVSIFSFYLSFAKSKKFLRIYEIIPI